MKRYDSLSDNPVAEAGWVLMCLLMIAAIFPRLGTLIFWVIIACGVWWFIASYLWWSRRRSAGKCAKCGYDLRATPDRCPECGTVPSARPRRQSMYRMAGRALGWLIKY